MAVEGQVCQGTYSHPRLSC